MKQLPRAAEQALTLRTAEFLRRDGRRRSGGRWSQDASAGSVGGRGPAAGTLRSPTRRACTRGCCDEGPGVRRPRIRAGLLSIEDGQTLRADRLAIRTPVVFQVADGQMQQGWAGVRLYGSTKVGVIGKDVAAVAAAPAGQPDAHAENHAVLDEPQAATAKIMGREAPVAVAAAATLCVTLTIGTRTHHGLVVFLDFAFSCG